MTTSLPPPSPKNEMQPSPANIHLMQLTTAYWTSRCLHVVAELGLADHLSDEPQSTESLAKATGTNAGSLYRVLRLLASVGVFEWHNGTWRHTEASRFLRSDNPGSLRQQFPEGGQQQWDGHDHATGEDGGERLLSHERSRSPAVSL